MRDKIVEIIVVLFLLSGTAALAQVEPPQDPFLPYYYVRGTVSLPGGGAASGRTVVFYLNNANLALGRYVRAVTNAGGYYELNAFELSYYFGDPVNVDGTSQYQVAVLNNPADNLGGDPQTIPLLTGQGFTEQNFTLTDGGGRISTFTLTSDFANGAGIPVPHADPAAGGANTSIPLTWSNPPAGTGSFALSVVDISAANTVHWLAINLPPGTANLPAGAALPGGSVQLDNYLGNMRYDGPNPPAADPAHNYVVTVYALQNTIAPVPANLNDFTAAINGATLLGQATIIGTFSRASAGAVALNIARQGSDILISWNNTVSPSPQIFFRTGDGTGQFVNAYDTNWLPATTANGFNLVNYSTGSILHTGQVGAGTSEAYYKAISAGVVVTSPGGLATFADAGAVGKANLELTGTINLISTPFEMTPNSIDDIFGGQINQNGMQFAGYDNTTKSYSIYEYAGTYPSGSWSLSTGNAFNVLPGAPYWLTGGRTGTITLIGSVPAVAYSAALSTGPNLFALPASRSLSPLANAGLSPRAGDSIARYNNTSKSYEILETVAGAWSVSAGESVFGLNPGWGYWYINSQSGDVNFGLTRP